MQASNDSVDCAVCHRTYHMNCIQPPLPKKPSRGFAWSCAACARAQERRLEARNTPNAADSGDLDEEDPVEDDEEEHRLATGGTDTGKTSPERSVDADDTIHPGTAEQIHQASLWPYRYLGVHCRVQDVLDYDDRIYPRASSRLGPRHQANLTPWPGRPIEYVKPLDIKRKYVKGGSKKDAKLSKDTLAAIEADKLAREKRPKWVMDEPAGYIHRGEDHDNDDPKNTARLMFKLPEVGEMSSLPARGGDEDDGDDKNHGDSEQRERLIDEYMLQAKPLSKRIGVPDYSVNFLDKALELLLENHYNAEAALQQLSSMTKKDLKEPDLTAAEYKKFEDGVAKYGAELLLVRRHVKSVHYGSIVRLYYAWKKSERGMQIRDNRPARKNKKANEKAEATAGKLQDDVADEHDDSAFDNDKAFERKRGFQCKFCSTRSSRQWRRAPNTAAGSTVSADASIKGSNKDKSNQLMIALCLRCSELWRRYAIEWEDIDEVAKKVAQAGGRAYRRKIDEELLKELVAANEIASIAAADNTATASTSAGGTPVPQAGVLATSEPPKKKLKASAEKEPSEGLPVAPSPAGTANQKKKAADKQQAGPPPPPAMPKPRPLPCAICRQMDPVDDQHLSCKECRLTVHRNCYGVVGEVRANKWVCDMCSNDKNPQVSIVSLLWIGTI
jgi:hypothetical protein